MQLLTFGVIYLYESVSYKHAPLETIKSVQSLSLLRLQHF